MAVLASYGIFLIGKQAFHYITRRYSNQEPQIRVPDYATDTPGLNGEDAATDTLGLDGEIVATAGDGLSEGSIQEKGWPIYISAYVVLKAAMNAYTRILAKKYPNFCIYAACPGYVKTYINMNTGKRSLEEGAESVVKLVLLPDGGPSGLFFVEGNISSFE
ncbi:(+)-neomenthol dehydrogenase [Heracleum sosnowskyi]|uniref:(+)-neomenthol dehydrogenase n=1 Tax=Heracleum sosnowskyi TaxID=360622 RepID=A0AAD8IBI8_9APIA|nr:(+)-neomenthol dehydrogenase [Heracleum sosnowskyi]